MAATKTKKPTAVRRTITEAAYQSADRKLSIDREAGVIRGVKLMSRDSRNGRRYSDQAIEQLREMYDGADVNIDHPAPGDVKRERSIRDAFGQVQQPRTEKDGIYGDVAYLKTHPLAESVLEMAERMPRNLGMSHNAIGLVAPGAKPGDPDLVESIVRVQSVDVVRTPATTRGLFESLEDDEDMADKKTEPKTLKQILESHSKDKEAARLLKLLEMDEMAAMAEEPMEVASEASAEDQVQAAFEAMVVSVLRDSSLDKQGKIGKIREILAAEEKLTKPAEKPADDSSSEGDEAMESLRESIVEMRVEMQIRDLLEEFAIPRASLDAARIKSLREAKDEAARRTLVESWPPATRGVKKPFVQGMRSSGQQTTVTESYEDLKKRVRRGGRKPQNV